ncbi:MULTISPECIES: hypothetical protein [Nitrospirillum]|nr:hypothetical protein [Nitrospirillum amazonense]MEC4589925.1 hypothetical protein [Nitrospirillum amazonense]
MSGHPRFAIVIRAKFAAFPSGGHEMVKETDPLQPSEPPQERSIETAAAFLHARAAGASGEGFAAFLARIPDAPPLSGDELPD